MKRASLVLSMLLGAGLLRAAEIPTPKSVFGFRPGDDYHLANYAQIVEYYRKLDAASDRIRVLEIGPTAEGRSLILAVISSEANMAKLERYREISRRLALARGVTDEEARALAREGKAIVWIDGGLHASEVAHAQHTPELAWKVASEESDEMKRIRDDVILLQVPVMNPDGLDIVVRWYNKNRGTPYETAPLPELYHKYVGHDNNRDWYMFNMPESRNVARYLYDLWFPQIVYNHHQSAPFPARIFVPPFDDPMNPNIPPLFMRGIQLVGHAMTNRFEAEGKSGVISRIGFDTWWNGGLRTAPYFHNQIGILTETALYRYAHPHTYQPSELPKTFSNGWPTDQPTTYYANPWKGGWWGLRAPIEYMLTGSMAVLDIGSKYRRDWLYNIYQMGKWAIEAGQKGGPFAYVIPAEQWDSNTAVRLIQVLRIGGVEVHRATAAFTAEGKPTGSYVILMAQPFHAYVRDLVEPQRYPDRKLNGVPLRPYDMTGWTLSYQMGVNVVTVDAPFEAPLEQVDKPELRPGRVPAGPAAAYAFTHRKNDSFRAASRLLAAGDAVCWAAEKIAAGGRELEAGTMIVLAGNGTQGRVETAARELGIDFTPLDARPTTPLLRLRAPRLGLYKSWLGNMDEGWTRWLLEQFEFPYTSVADADLRKGDLKSRFDVIVLPSMTPEQMVNGWPEGMMPPEYVGGMGLEGVAAIKEFVKAGGTLVAMDLAGDLVANELNVPVRDVLASTRPSEFYCPGSLLRVQIDNTHPIAWGMERDGVAFFVNSPAYDIGRGGTRESGDAPGEERPAPRNVRVIARYPGKNVLLSGWLLGEQYLQNRAAILEVAVGKGKAILLGFRTQFRGQPHSTFKLLFNSILYGPAVREVLP